jgi:hypothetical protein
MAENDTPNDSTIYVATESFVTIIDGERIAVHKGKTRVRAGHPLHKAAPNLFKPLDVHYDIETARQEPTPPPPAPTPTKKAAAKKAAASPSEE